MVKKFPPKAPEAFSTTVIADVGFDHSRRNSFSGHAFCCAIAKRKRLFCLFIRTDGADCFAFAQVVFDFFQFYFAIADVRRTVGVVTSLTVSVKTAVPRVI